MFSLDEGEERFYNLMGFGEPLPGCEIVTIDKYRVAKQEASCGLRQGSLSSLKTVPGPDLAELDW